MEEILLEILPLGFSIGFHLEFSIVPMRNAYRISNRKSNPIGNRNMISCRESFRISYRKGNPISWKLNFLGFPIGRGNKKSHREIL